MNFEYKPVVEDFVEFTKQTRFEQLREELDTMKSNYHKVRKESSEKIGLAKFLIGCGWYDNTWSMREADPHNKVFFFPNYVFFKKDVDYIIEIELGGNIKLHDENIGNPATGRYNVMMTKGEFYE